MKRIICIFIMGVLLCFCGCNKDESLNCGSCGNTIELEYNNCPYCGIQIKAIKPDEYYENVPDFSTFNYNTNEKDGVPDSIVDDDLFEESFKRHYLSFLDIAYECYYTIEHDVDTTAHIDNVTIEFTAKGEYGIQTEICQFKYQYDRSSDLWTLVEKGDWNWDFQPDYEAFIGNWQLHSENLVLNIYECDNEKVRVMYADTDNIDETIVEDEYVYYESFAALELSTA